jgi:CTP synthase (UTP-ammonia lyase)
LERHRHRYEFNNTYRQQGSGMIFRGSRLNLLRLSNSRTSLYAGCAVSEFQSRR